MTTDDQCIRMEQVCYAVGGRTILTNFDLLLERGVNRTILGVSGSGKTTILKLLLGLIHPQSGRILINGMEITGQPEAAYREQRKKIAIVFQGGALFDSMTVGENVGYRLFEEGRLSEAEIEQIVREKLRFVGVEPALNLYPAELSGGMKKRVAIARAIALNPKYLFCDEPNSGLDPQTAILIDNLLLELTRDFNMTTIINTHDLNSVMEIGENILFLSEGRHCWEGTREEILLSDNPVLNDFVFASELMKKFK